MMALRRGITCRYLASGAEIPADLMYALPKEKRRSLVRPKRIFVVRHGESLGNISPEVYINVPDWRISLTEEGKEQAKATGSKISHIIGEDPVFFYTSPYRRTKETLQSMVTEFEQSDIVGVREEPRLTEQQFGNFQNLDEIQICKVERSSYGRFYYRFPQGESGFDVYTRVSTFLPDLYRDAANAELFGEGQTARDLNVVIVSHGLTLRLLLMRWFQYTISDFEQSHNPPNAAFVVMERREDQAHTGREWYELTEESLKLLNYSPPEHKGSLWKLMSELSHDHGS